MKKLCVIGNLAADAEVKVANGSPFVSFSVYDSRKYQRADGTVVEESDRISCAWNGDGGNLLPYLRKGVKVYVEGYCSTVVYSSPTEKRMKAGINLSVFDIQLCGGTSDSMPRELVTEDGELISPTLALVCPADWVDAIGCVKKKYFKTTYMDRNGGVWSLCKNGIFVKKAEEAITSDNSHS